MARPLNGIRQSKQPGRCVTSSLAPRGGACRLGGSLNMSRIASGNCNSPEGGTISRSNTVPGNGGTLQSGVRTVAINHIERACVIRLFPPEPGSRQLISAAKRPEYVGAPTHLPPLIGLAPRQIRCDLGIGHTLGAKPSEYQKWSSYASRRHWAEGPIA